MTHTSDTPQATPEPEGPIGRFVTTSQGQPLRGIVVAWALIDPDAPKREGRQRGEAAAIVLIEDGGVAFCFHSGKWTDTYIRVHVATADTPAQAFERLCFQTPTIMAFHRLGRWDARAIARNLDTLWGAIQDSKNKQEDAA